MEGGGEGRKGRYSKFIKDDRLMELSLRGKRASSVPRDDNSFNHIVRTIYLSERGNLFSAYGTRLLLNDQSKRGERGETRAARNVPV